MQIKFKCCQRKIRADKRTQEALEAAGETEYAKTVKKRIAAENKALRAYCEQEGLTYRQDRTQIYGYSDTSRKKKAVDFVETVDKSGQGGIIKLRGRNVVLENQRYGRNKDTIVNKSYIDGGEYKRKFDNATDNPNVNKSLYDCAKSALKHRSGTIYEDMYWIDMDTGKIILSVVDSTDERAIVYTKKSRKQLKEMAILRLSTLTRAVCRQVSTISTLATTMVTRLVLQHVITVRFLDIRRNKK